MPRTGRRSLTKQPGNGSRTDRQGNQMEGEPRHVVSAPAENDRNSRPKVTALFERLGGRLSRIALVLFALFGAALVFYRYAFAPISVRSHEVERGELIEEVMGAAGGHRARIGQSPQPGSRRRADRSARQRAREAGQIDSLASLFGTVELLYIVLLAWLGTDGAGPLSLDRGDRTAAGGTCARRHPARRRLEGRRLSDAAPVAPVFRRSNEESRIGDARYAP